jgi:flavin-binding protein dodecin
MGTAGDGAGTSEEATNAAAAGGVQRRSKTADDLAATADVLVTGGKLVGAVSRTNQCLNVHDFAAVSQHREGAALTPPVAPRLKRP